MRIPAFHPLFGLPAFFSALSDLTRLRLLNLLSDGEVCVCFLAETLGLAQPTVSRHLAFLKRAGLVTARRQGKWMYYAWAEEVDGVRRNLLAGLRDWFTRDPALAAEREALGECACK